LNKIKIVGLGPGNKNYILPAALSAVNESDIIIAGKRNLAGLDTSGKRIIEVRNNLLEISDFIKMNMEHYRIAVAVSGDPGFYSMLGFLKNHFNRDEMEVIPGISSFQYMFCKLGIPWENFFPASVHGRDCNVAGITRMNKNVFFLTDTKFTCKKIAAILYESGMGEKMIYAGNNLSYKDEIIVSDKAGIFKDKDFDFENAVTVVCDE
jgi:cobalt-precorrin-7 (C5)-methyltransferase